VGARQRFSINNRQLIGPAIILRRAHLRAISLTLFGSSPAAKFFGDGKPAVKIDTKAIYARHNSRGRDHG
jgi:hypothetical protein